MNIEFLNFLTSWVLMKQSKGLSAIMLLGDLALCFIIVAKVAYTEIDWIAYMEEVESFLGGERNYTKIIASTGPLVYPAGFLYIFAVLRTLTQDGSSIITAQYIFLALYLIHLFVTHCIYSSDPSLPFFSYAFLSLSKRIHSIYMLRMFNDCVAVLLGSASLLLFSVDQWRWGSLVYSLGVSVKMNLLLYAPGILLLYLLATGLWETVVCLGICAVVQVVLGWPFLASFPREYLGKAFELGRVFTYKWTVNLKFLSEEVFVSRALAMGLLMGTILAYLLFAQKWVVETRTQQEQRDLDSQKTKNPSIIGLGRLTPQFVVTTVWISNFIGIVFARSLHYQFYCWYAHSLPFLLWHSRLPLLLQGALLVGVEVSFNVFPATYWSSLLLQGCHIVLLVSLYLAPIPRVVDEGEIELKCNKEKLK